MKRKAIFLDRDGVLNNAIVKNGKPYPPSSLEELVIPEDAEEALSYLKAAGFLLIGATNQPDVVRGKTSIQLVEEINHYLINILNLDEIRVCYHDDSDKCQCRKPLPGLLIEAARNHHIDMSQSFMIGDRWRDIDAGNAAGCRTILLKSFYKEKNSLQPPTYSATSLLEAAQWILKNTEVSQ